MWDIAPTHHKESAKREKKVFLIGCCYVLFIVLVKLIFMLQPLILKLYDSNFLHLPRIFFVVAPTACPPVKNAGIMHNYGHCLKSLDYSSLLGIEVQHKKVHVLKLWNIVYAVERPSSFKSAGGLSAVVKCIRLNKVCSHEILVQHMCHGKKFS